MFVVFVLNAYLNLRFISSAYDYPKHLVSSDNKLSDKYVMCGVLLTTLTGILPTVAVDPLEDNRLYSFMEACHIGGIMCGILLFIKGNLSRIWGGYCMYRYGVPHGNHELDTSVMIDCSTIFFFVAMLEDLLFHMWYMKPVAQSHICIKYHTEAECNGEDRDLHSLRLNTTEQPWPCVWDRSAIVHCTNPKCNFDFNANMIFAEYYTLACSLVILASYQSQGLAGIDKGEGGGGGDDGADEVNRPAVGHAKKPRKKKKRARHR
jgi:hypothetical protein